MPHHPTAEHPCRARPQSIPAVSNRRIPLRRPIAVPQQLPVVEYLSNAKLQSHQCQSIPALPNCENSRVSLQCNIPGAPQRWNSPTPEHHSQLLSPRVLLPRSTTMTPCLQCPTAEYPCSALRVSLLCPTQSQRLAAVARPVLALRLGYLWSSHLQSITMTSPEGAVQLHC